MATAGVFPLGLLVCAVAAAQDSTGTIAGKVTLAASRRATLATSAYGRRDVGPKAPAGTPEARKVVVYVPGLRHGGALPAMRSRVAQKDEQFRPQLTAVTTGSTVDFPNEDPFFHNVFSLSRAATFDLLRYRSGESRSQEFRKPGIVKVFCHLHSQMNAVIMVFDHPWFAIPSEDGTFRIENVPYGDHAVVAWHERIGEVRTTARVKPGAVAQLSFTLPVLEPR